MQRVLDADLGRDLEAPARIHGAELVNGGAGKAYCRVWGRIAPTVMFEMRLPIEHWNERLLYLGCGGYCGFIEADPFQVPHLRGSSDLDSYVTVASDQGHSGNPRHFADGLWAINNPCAVFDFAYLGVHKTAVVAKAVTELFYNRKPYRAYYAGCSDGGRGGLQSAQRYPGDFDGILLACPTIDVTTINTFYHAWNIRTNTGRDGAPILTEAKVQRLAAYLVARFGDEKGLIQDPRLVRISAADIVAEAGLDEIEAATVLKLWQGPRDEQGRSLSTPAPVGSELAWIGAMVPADGGAMDPAHVNEADWSSDFPNFMSRLGDPTGITYRNIDFSAAAFDELTQLSGVYDPTNTDLAAFADRGGKLLLWHGWADHYAPPFMSLNYLTELKRAMGDNRVSEFFKLFMLPGVFHCAGGPRPVRHTFLDMLVEWVEHGRDPHRAVVEFLEDEAVSFSRPAFPYPSVVAWDGKGDPANQTSYKRRDLPCDINDTTPWVGLQRYRPGKEGFDGSTFR